MEQRIDMWKQAPDAFKAVLALETYAKKNVDPPPVSYPHLTLPTLYTV